MKRKKINALLAAVLASVVIISGCGSSSGNDSSQGGSASASSGSASAAPESASGAASSSLAAGSSGASLGGKTITYANGASWNSLNPYNNGGYFYSTQVVSKIFDTLAYVDNKTEIQPREAESWEAEDDGKSIVFHLNPDSKWQDDGSPVTAQDWVFTLNLITDPETDVTTKSRLNVLEGTDEGGNHVEGEELGVEARDDYTLVFHLKEASYPEAFILSVARYYLYPLPEHLLKDVKPADLGTSDFWNNPVGSGPFRFVSENAGTELTLSSYEDYQLGAPKFDNLVYKVLDPSNMLTSMAAGEIDACYPSISVDEAESIRGVYDNIVVDEDSVNATMYSLAIRNDKYDRNVRQAISLAADKQLMVDQLALGHGNVATTYLDTSSPYHNDDITFTRDVEKAKELLKEDGWDPSNKITLAIQSGTREKVAALLQANLAEAGINLEIITVDGTTMFSGFADGTYDSIIVTTVPIDPLNGIGQLSTSSSWAGRPVNNDLYDEMVRIRSELDEDKRAELINKAQADMAEELVNIPLYEEYVQNIHSSRVSGITSVATDAPWTWTVND